MPRSAARWMVGSVAVALVVTACGSNQEPDHGPRVGKIEVAPTALVLAPGQSAELRVHVLSTDDELLVGMAVSFATSNDAAATVSNTGIVTAVAPGNADVTVSAGDGETVIPVIVQAVPNAIIITPQYPTVPQTGSVQLAAVVTDADGEPIPGAPIFWRSEQSSLGSVSPDGLVQPVGPAGSLQVTAASGALSRSIQVEITQVATTLDVAPAPVVLGKRGTAQLTVRALDAVGAPMGEPVVTLTSSSGIITVGGDGLVRATGTPGVATITVRVGNAAQTVKAEVIDYPGLAGIVDGQSPMPGDLSVYSVDLRDDGAILAVGTIWGENAGLAIASTAARTFTALPVSGSFATDVAFSSAGTAWLANAPNQGASEITPETGAVLGVATGITPGFDVRYSILVSPDASQVYLAGGGMFYAIDAATRAVTRSLSLNSLALSLVKHPTANRFYTTGDGLVQEVDPVAGTVKDVGSSISAKNLGISTSGSKLYLVSEGRDLRVIDIATGMVESTFLLPCWVWGIEMSPDRSTALLMCSSSGRVLLVNPETGVILSDMTVAGSPRRAVFSPDGLRALVAAEGGGVVFIR